jgi:sulfopropanediol 3-dehydrogenase
MEHFKRATHSVEEEDKKIQEVVEGILRDIDANGEDAVRAYAKKFDQWEGEIILSDAKKARLIAQVPEQTKADIQFAYDQVKRFAEAQRASLTDVEVETMPGVILGQRVIPVQCAGCYVPGGRYAHAASAIMSVTTAKVAGVPTVIACSPPRDGSIAPAVVYAMDLAGADVILELGGVQAIAAMVNGLFTGKEADIIVGPGNAYVAEAKRLLFGRVGIDVFAGPTESAVIADETADPMTVAIDLVSQAEHGTNSPVWLFTTSRALAEEVTRIIPQLTAQLSSGDVAQQAWDALGEIYVCDTREEVVEISDRYASEHLQVIAKDLPWWKENLQNYGSLFLGEGSTVTHGDKCVGTNHILPTRQAGRYSGGLNVQKFLKVLTYQQVSPEANLELSAIGSRISRTEGMEGHARACDWRLTKYFPEKEWDFEVYRHPTNDQTK